MPELQKVLPDFVHELVRKKTQADHSLDDDLVVVEPERRSARGVICLFTTMTAEGEKFVMMTLPEEDFNGQFTKAERGIQSDGLLYINKNMLAFPSGALEAGEDPVAAVAREINEEDSLLLVADRLNVLPIPNIEVFQSTVGNAGSFPAKSAGPQNSGLGFIKVKREDLGKINFRYGYYTFTLDSFHYQLTDDEVEILKKNMQYQGREVRLLTRAEALALQLFDIRPSSKQLLLEYLKLVK